ncbi:MAG: hypothetical protein BA863_07695 [Desulfovibrio sp. S3730MH75]|nr:MAG: hypothetical protein BA863_07695 [Desulfovibrio sp. S3730MH75]
MGLFFLLSAQVLMEIVMNCIKIIVSSFLLVLSASTVFAAQILPIVPAANTAASPVAQTTATTPPTVAQDIYQDGLIAVMYTDDSQSGTWASAKPVGVPIGEFVATTVPNIAFSDIKSDPNLWQMYKGAHVGLELNGFFNAEEDGTYVIGLRAAKTTQDRIFINSFASSIDLGGKPLVIFSERLKKASWAWKNHIPLDKNKFTSVKLTAGYYPIKIWVHCGVTKNKWGNWVDQANALKWTVIVKRPSDRTIAPAPQGTLVWK